MATKRYDPSDTGFDARYARWVAALESGDEAELLEATMAIPTLSSRVLDEYFAVEGDDLETPRRRVMEQRLTVLLSEVRPRDAARLRELRTARQRRRGPTSMTMPGPPPPWGIAKVLCRFRCDTSEPNLPGFDKPTCAFIFAPSM